MERSTMNTLSQHVHDERNGLDYTLHGDYYLPDLEVPDTPPLNHWGRMVFDRLQKQHPVRRCFKDAYLGLPASGEIFLFDVSGFVGLFP